MFFVENGANDSNYSSVVASEDQGAFRPIALKFKMLQLVIMAFCHDAVAQSEYHIWVALEGQGKLAG